MRRALALTAVLGSRHHRAKSNGDVCRQSTAEILVKESLELPAFSTLDEIASWIRREVNTAMFERIAGRIGLPDRVGLKASLEVVESSAKTPYNRLKQAAGKASWPGFREQVEHLRWVDYRRALAWLLAWLARRHRGVAGWHRGVEDRRLRW